MLRERIIMLLPLRVLAVTMATLLYGMVFFASRWLAPHTSPVILRRYLERRGGGFIKLGKVLAMRFDLLPPAYTRELALLLDRIPPMPIARVRKIVRAELGPKADELVELEQTALGSASIAQVHAAKLRDGTEVVVKVMRQGVARRLRLDLLLLSVLARLLELIGSFGARDITGVVDEVSRLSKEELDFRREAFQADLMHQLLEADELDHYAPRVYFRYLSPRLLTLERLRGVWAQELIATRESGDVEALAELRARGIDLRRSARLLLHSLLTQCLRHRVFHADPHAANIMVMEGGTLAYVDFGMLGRLDERLAWLQRQVIRDIAAERYHAAFGAMLATIDPRAIPDLGRFQTEVQDLFATWRMVAAHPESTVAEKSSGLLFLRIADVIRRYRLQLPSRMTRYYRAQIVADMAIYGLDPELDPTAEFLSFGARIRRSELRDALSANSVLERWSDAIVRGPEIADVLLRWIELRLPRMGEMYNERLGALERLLVVTLRGLHSGLLVGLLVVVAVVIIDGPSAADVGPLPWWGLVAILLVLSFSTRRMHRALIDPD